MVSLLNAARGEPSRPFRSWPRLGSEEAPSGRIVSNDGTNAVAARLSGDVIRFHLGREERRISYFIAPGHRIVLVTVFRKTKPRETAEINRAEAAMKGCITERHTAE